MIKEIITYPTPLSVAHSTDVRVFDASIVTLLEDLKETIEDKNLDALSAFQIGSYYNIVVLKDTDGSLIEIVNPRLIGHSGSTTTAEATAYFPDMTAEIKRYENISVVYQDRTGKDSLLKVSGDLAITLQRKIDYTFGATFLHRMSQTQKEQFQNRLEFGGDIESADYCPTTFKRDKIIKLINIVLIVMAVAFVGSFFVSEAELLSTIWTYQLYTSFGVLGLNIIYFFYAQYEGKLYTSCSSCQLGNIIGTVVISLVKLSLLMVLSYLFINPS